MKARLACAIRARRQDDKGFVAGADMLIFGTVTFVIGTLLIMNVWAVIDTQLAVSAAAREGARAYAEIGESEGEAGAAAANSVQRVMSEFGKTRAPAVALPTVHARCAFVTVTVQYDVALVSLPVFGDLGDRTVTASHSTRVDAWRSGDFDPDFDGNCA